MISVCALGDAEKEKLGGDYPRRQLCDVVEAGPRVSTSARLHTSSASDSWDIVAYGLCGWVNSMKVVVTPIAPEETGLGRCC